MSIQMKYKRAYKGLAGYMLSDYKRMFLLAAVLLAFNTIENIVYTLATYKKFSVSSSDFPYFGVSIGASIGVGIVVCMLAARIFMSTTKKNISYRLRLPINRRVLAVGNFVNIVSSTVLLLLMIIAAILVEEIFGRILSAVGKDVILLQEMNLLNFIEGFWVTASFMILIASLAYCIGIYFFRYTILTTLILAILISLISIFPSYVGKLFYESSILIFSIKVWLMVIALQVISYLPLKKAEVNL